ncbi:hypothetical protein [Sphingopyxis sp. JAI128]|uniref:hypothetical protein n=1 Tax=Sphingopyxis sp. JAI128 TaxID=2723066 RepID=UPI00161216EB|nr:hypothetical protein [Sphingopyxis sp. JAI128]MBB6424912.1 hypothetical protein [Sphingopyxis sp. JAI128]
MANGYDSFARAQLERAENWDEAIKAMPALHFPKSWAVTIIPPFCGAMARFLVEKGSARVSVYADFNEALGYYGGPHWEIYPGVSGENERFDISDSETLLSEIGKSLRKQSRKAPA